MAKNKLAIFDLDGTLFNTDEVNYHAYRDALQKYDIEVDHDYYVEKCNGKHYTEFLLELGIHRNDFEDIHEMKKIAYEKYLGKAYENSHLFNILLCMRPEYNIALVTTASRKNTMDILSYFNRIDCFDLIITQEDYEKTKPNPDGFLLAMREFAVKSENTVIFEDSDVGIAAARKLDVTIFAINKF